MTKPQWSFESKCLRELAKRPDTVWVFRKHADEEMAKDDILSSDVINVVSRGYVATAERPYDRWRFQVNGRNVDGEMITVVAEPDETKGKIKIITAWKSRHRRN